MRWFFAALLACCLAGANSAHSLQAIVADTHQGGAGCVGYTGPGDIVPSAVAWWGLRAYSCAVADGTHKSINLSRSSDTHTCDVLLTTSGFLGNTTGCSTGGDNGTAVATWCNATTCNIVKWYDQSGNSRDALSPSAGLATLTFSPTTADFTASTSRNNYCTTGTVSLPQPATLSSVFEPTAIVGGQFQAAVGASAAFTQMGISSTNGDLYLFAGAVVDVVETYGVYYAVQGVFNGASSHLYVNGTDNTGNPGAGSSTASILCLGADSNGNNAFQHQFIREGGIWASAFTPTQAANVTSNQRDATVGWNF